VVVTDDPRFPYATKLTEDVKVCSNAKASVQAANYADYRETAMTDRHPRCVSPYPSTTPTTP
jgi:hypothetical protein